MEANLLSHVISFRIRSNDDNLKIFDLWAQYGESAGNVMRWQKGTSHFDRGEWHQVVLHPAEKEAGAVTDFTNLHMIRVGISPASGLNTSVDLADFRIHPAGPPPGKVAFMFDDALISTYETAFPLLSAKGWVAGTAVEYEAVGDPQHCTLEKLNEMYAAGWEMHGHSTRDVGSMSEAGQTSVHKEAQDFLSSNGFRRGSHIWVWPGGHRTPIADAIALQFWGTLRQVASPTALGAPHVYDPKDPPNLYIGPARNLKNVKTFIDGVAAAGGSVVMVFHRLVNTTDRPEDWLIPDFSSLLNYIEEAGCEVVPPSKIWAASASLQL